MIPIALRVTKFRSFRGTQTLLFPREPGLYFMQGINVAEPRLEANGSGKSTLWDALTWCIFGKTSRGLKAGDVCNWEDGKGARVEFDFTLSPPELNDDPCVWTVTRSWSPNSWTLSSITKHITDEDQVIDLTKEKDNPLMSWLRLSFEAFLSCVFTAQSQPMFLDLGREAQASLFSEVLNLDAWIEFSARASKLAEEQDRRVRDLERSLAKLHGEMEALGAGRNFREASERWEKDRHARIDDLTAKHVRVMLQRGDLKDQLARAQAQEEAARNCLEIAAEHNPDQELAERLRGAEELERRTHRELTAEEVANDAVREHIGHLEKAAQCPTCGQALDPVHRQREMSRALKARDVSDYQLDALMTRHNEVAALVHDLALRVENGRRHVREAEDAIEGAQRSVSAARRNLALTDADLDRIEDEAERIAAERNPYAEMQREMGDRERRLTADIRAAEARRGALEERHALLIFWARGFKEVRLSQIAEALTELEVEVNSCCDALGLVSWELEFHVDRTNKAGGLQRGFNCLVRSPHNTHAVPWASWSGGEAQRLRIAATMGRADLIRSRTGASLALEVWDEPTDGLSPQGTRDLLECLARRAVRERRQIWVVDHTSHDFGGFAGGALVTKTDAGSVITQ